jgi:hypothetical protein
VNAKLESRAWHRNQDEERLPMRSPSRSRSLLRAAAWVYFGPLVAVGGLALFALGFAALAVAIQLLAAILKHAGM